MNEQENSTLNGNLKPNSEENSHENELAVDSWLIYLSRDLGKVFRKGKNEIDTLVDSTRSAYATTQKISKKIVENPTVKRYSSYGLASNGVLFLARSSGKASRIIESGTERGLSKIGKAMKGKKKNKFRAIKLEIEPATSTKAKSEAVKPKEAPATVRKASDAGTYKSTKPDTKVSEPVTPVIKESKPASVTDKAAAKEASSLPDSKPASTKAYKSVIPAPKISKPEISPEKKIPQKESAPAAGKNINTQEAPSSLIDKAKTYKAVTPAAKLTQPVLSPPQEPVKAIRDKTPLKEAGKTKETATNTRTYTRKTIGSTTKASTTQRSTAKKPATSGTRKSNK